MLQNKSQRQAELLARLPSFSDIFTISSAQWRRRASSSMARGRRGQRSGSAELWWQPDSQVLGT